MEQDQISDLIEKYVSGLATDAERRLLQQWYRDTAYRDVEYPDTAQAVKNRMLLRLEREITPVSRKYALFSRTAVAASLLFCLGIGFYFYSSRNKVPDTAAMQLENDIAPGGNRAVLTLANGNKIKLSDVQTGVVINTGRLTYCDGSQVNVQHPSAQDMQKILTISTPLGGTYQVILPDSTKVWLNAASELKFPATFAGGLSRKVELRGEAYFEVARLTKGLKRVPFIVVSKAQEVEVLGTHFNINAYPEEATKTSLLEGMVRIKNDKGNVLLKPGQQAVSMVSGIELISGDAEDAIAWKKGYFMFDNEDLAGVMGKLSRWYNVNVSYEDAAVKNVKYYGTISRFEKISKVLSKLETTGNLKFEIKDKTVKVSQK